MSGNGNDHSTKSSTPRTTQVQPQTTGGHGEQGSVQPVTTGSGDKPPPPRR